MKLSEQLCLTQLYIYEKELYTHKIINHISQNNSYLWCPNLYRHRQDSMLEIPFSITLYLFYGHRSMKRLPKDEIIQMIRLIAMHVICHNSQPTHRGVTASIFQIKSFCADHFTCGRPIGNVQAEVRGISLLFGMAAKKNVISKYYNQATHG